MGRSSGKKRDRRAAKVQAVRVDALADKSLEALTKVPDAYSHAIFELSNSVVTLRGKEPKQKLEDGRLYVKCDKMALIPLQEYRALIDITLKANAAQAQLLEQLLKLREEAKAREQMIQVVPGSALPKPPSPGGA